MSSRFRRVSLPFAGVILAVSTLPVGLIYAQSQTTAAGGTASNNNPFSQLNEEVTLPPVPSDSTAASVASVDLGELDPAYLTGGQITLFSELANLEGLYQFTCRQKAPQVGDEWLVFVSRPPEAKSTNTPAIGSGRLLSEPVSRIYNKSGRLLLEWNSNNITRYNGQLSNAVLDFSSGPYSHSILLRKLETQDAILLDLEKDVIRIPVKLANLPRKEVIGLTINDVEFQGYEAHQPGFQLQPASGTAKLGDVVRLTRADGVNTEISISLIDRDSGPELIIRATYRPAGERKAPFVAKNINSARQKLQRTLEENQTRMANAQAAIPALESRVRAAIARQPRDESERSARAAEISQAKDDLRKAQSAVRRYERSLPKLKASLDGTNEIVEVGKLLHNKIRFHIAILATGGSRSLELVRFGDTKVAQGSALVTMP